MRSRNIFILSAGSDIGKELVIRFASNSETTVVGTYRTEDSVKDILNKKNIHLMKCDLLDNKNIKRTVTKYGLMGLNWDMFISCAGTLEPISGFFDCDYDKWESSVNVNAIGQLRFLHAIYPYRNKNKISNVALFAGGGTNNPLRNYSAYCISKLMLIKMCELLDDENNDINVFILGPGWVRTKLLDQTVRNQRTAGKIYDRTVDFLGSKKIGTSYDDIYECINWCAEQGRPVIGGRNLSIVHDAWRNGGRELACELRKDPDKFKLRRYANE